VDKPDTAKEPRPEPPFRDGAHRKLDKSAHLINAPRARLGLYLNRRFDRLLHSLRLAHTFRQPVEVQIELVLKAPLVVQGSGGLLRLQFLRLRLLDL